MLKIVQSNRLDLLAWELVAASGLPSRRLDLRPDIIVVPHSGIARWLKYRIAEAKGVCANVEFPYPAQLLWRLISLVVPGVPARSPFDVEVMAWRIFARLEALPDTSETAPLRAYATAHEARERLGLAQRIASVFDAYLVHRPDWLRAWADGRLLGLEPRETERWQAWLWQELLRESGTSFTEHPRAAFFSELARLQSRGTDLTSILPPAVSVFGVPLLPPLYLGMFLELARYVDVNCYVLNPCREYWADIVAERDLARLKLEGDALAEYAEVGHPLLASWGKQARDNLALFAALIGEEDVQEEAHFEAPHAESLLARLQRSIVDLQDITGASIHLPEFDTSIRIHVCHSLTRELEVLHDQLLHLFEALPDLHPSDIVVMTPELDAAAPVIDAVFGTVPPERRIPYAITGRAKPDATPVLRAFLDLLALPDSRFEAATVVDLIQVPAVARRFRFAEDELAQVRIWLREAGVRWGRDADHRQSLGLPAESRHTWAEGLSRLFLGYALPAGGERLFAGLLPFDELEGSQGQVLGKLARFVSEATRAAEVLARPRAPSDWSGLLNGLIERFFDPNDEEAQDIERLREALRSFGETAAVAGVLSHVPASLVASDLAARVSGRAPGGVPTGSVSFCGLGPLRALPYRVVCLVGLSDGAFPRNPSPLEFDLMARAPRLGDRARRDDDRGNFLDALLAARDVFYVSYVGRSIRDNARVPPSVVISELLDYLGRCAEGGRKAVEACLVVEHPLQPFSRRYYEGGTLFSFAGEQAAAARMLSIPAQARAPARGVSEGPLPPPEDELRQVDLGRLVRFFNHPVKFILRERLGIGIEEAEEELSADEPFVLAREDGWQLSERLIGLVRSGAPADQIGRIARAGTELPHGMVGEVVLGRELFGAGQFAVLLDRIQPATTAEPLAFDLSLGEFRLTGALRGLSTQGQFGFSFARRSGFALLTAWLRHLALNALKPAGIGLSTRWLMRDKHLEFAPVEGATGLLEDLLTRYWQGLQVPLAIPIRTALKLVEESDNSARSRWTGNQRIAGENTDPWFRLL
jgi:exodeoxyribonuclease V gamma subunit